MATSTKMGFDELVEIARRLPAREWFKLKLAVERRDVQSEAKTDLKAFLLKGPTFSEEQIVEIEHARKAISSWRKD